MPTIAVMVEQVQERILPEVRMVAVLKYKTKTS